MMDDWWTAISNCTVFFFTNDWSAGRVGRVRPLICRHKGNRDCDLAPVARALGGCRFFGFSCKAIA